MGMLLLRNGGGVPLVNLRLSNSIFHDLSQQGDAIFFEVGVGE